MTVKPLRLSLPTILRAAAAGTALARIARGADREARLEVTAPGSRSNKAHAPGRGEEATAPTVAVIVLARNEEERLGPCLQALARDPAVADIVVVDDESTDATAAVARAHGARVVPVSPRPDGWAGKTWALQRGIEAVNGEWVVSLDADTRAVPGLVATAVDAARRAGADLLTVGGRFDCTSAGERFLHPAMLATLVYRFGPPGSRRRPRPGRALANGQCMVFPRAAFLAAGGFAPVAASLVEDVALARHITGAGGNVRFVDGTRLLGVEGYGSAAAVWRGWGRSIGLAEVTRPLSQVADLALVWMAMAAPLPRLLAGRGDALDVALVAMRAGVLLALADTYGGRGLMWWLSPLADCAVACKLTATTLRPVRTWRGRTYGPTTGRLAGDQRRQPSRIGAR